MIAGNADVIKNAADLSGLGVCFSSKPLVIGGLAMEYYGLRKHGDDIDLIIASNDYQILADMYPDCRKDRWGDLGVKAGRYELFRSIFRLDYDFYSERAAEYERFKVVSFERLIFMKAIAVRNQPEIQKHMDDFGLVVEHYAHSYRNQEYAQNAELHVEAYLNAPNGTIFGGKY